MSTVKERLAHRSLRSWLLTVLVLVVIGLSHWTSNPIWFIAIPIVLVWFIISVTKDDRGLK